MLATAAAAGCRLFKSCTEKKIFQIVLNVTKSITKPNKHNWRECREHAMPQQQLTVLLHEFDSIL